MKRRRIINPPKLKKTNKRALFLSRKRDELYPNDSMGPHMKELGQMWRDLPSDTKDAYDDAAQEINRASSSTESPADIAKRVYADVQDVAKTLCELPELHKNGTHLLVMGCSSSGEPFVLSSSPAVRAYYDKNILHYSGIMDVPAIEEEASNRRPESAAVNMSMSNDNIEMNIRGFFKGLYDFREAPIKSQSDGRGVPWKHLREYGYTISNFPSHLDITRPGDWSKEDKVKLWEARAAFKFVKTTREEVESTNAHPVSQPVSQRSLPIIVPVAPVVASQALTVKETVKNLYLMNQTTCKPFLLRLQRDHPELVERATIGTIKNWVAQWRTSSSQVASSSS